MQSNFNSNHTQTNRVSLKIHFLSDFILHTPTPDSPRATSSAAKPNHRPSPPATTTPPPPSSSPNPSSILTDPPPSSITPNTQFFGSFQPGPPARPDRKSPTSDPARQLQNRRLWTYALTFSCIAGFVVIVLNQFQDQLVFYVTPTEALEKYNSDPSKSKFRLGGLVLENSVAQIPSSPEIQFVVTDLITDILVKYEGSLPDLFREGHSAVVEGFIKPLDEETKKKEEAVLRNSSKFGVSEKARRLECYFLATEVLAKHDEKYMPAEVANAIEKNKKLIEEQEKERNGGEALINAAAKKA